jgi:molybdate transport system substrate-binding protein
MNVGRAASLALLTALASAGCGGGGRPTLTVSAAASLQKAFTTYAAQFSGATARFSFAGSDTLAAQIEQGVRPDLFAAANTELPAILYGKGLVQKPVVFAANKLVLAVPTDSTKVRTLGDVEKPGMTLVIGSQTVPVGAYTNEVLARLPAAARTAVKANVKDREPDVTGIVGKLSQGAAEAGFLYASDVAASAGTLKAIDLPSSLQPNVAYAIAVVKGTAHLSQARQFIAGLLSGAGRSDLLADGFLPPPGG